MLWAGFDFLSSVFLSSEVLDPDNSFLSGLLTSTDSVFLIAD
jgi:hypothetical protein